MTRSCPDLLIVLTVLMIMVGQSVASTLLTCQNESEPEQQAGIQSPMGHCAKMDSPPEKETLADCCHKDGCMMAKCMNVAVTLPSNIPLAITFDHPDLRSSYRVNIQATDSNPLLRPPIFS